MFDLSTAYNTVKSAYGHLAKGVHPQLTLPPLRVTFEVTYRCNLSCSFCFQEFAREESSEFRKNYELNNEEILSALDELPRHALITFNGGEVFVRKDFPDLLRAVSERGRRFNIVTNGTMLFEDKVKLLVDETKALSVGISIDGIGATHDTIRRLPKAFERTVANMRQLIDYRRTQNRSLPVLDMKTVITADNIDQLTDIYLLGRDIGVDYLTYSCLRTSELLFALPCRHSMDDGAYNLAPEPLDAGIDLRQLQEQLESIQALAKEGGPGLRFYPSYDGIAGILKYYANKGELADYEPCSAPWTNIRVAPNGDIYPCLSYRMGNIRQDGLIASWKGPEMERFRGAFGEGLLPACLGCCNLKAKNGIRFEISEPGADRLQTECASVDVGKD